MTCSLTLHHTDGTARTGTLSTAHGDIQTPAFMPVGTAATVKGMLPEQVKATGADILLGNTYHLMLRPSAELIADMGGLHQFMNWPGPILTDSGGFQVMSLSGLRKMSEEGVRFKSHLDGTAYMLSPERSIEIQHLLDADITMAFDECTPWPVEKGGAADSMRLSMRWAERSRDAFTARDGYGIFGIVQGSIFKDLRHESVAALEKLNFHGLAIGGLAVGEGQELMFQVLDDTMPVMPESLPRYLMGVGNPDDILGAVARGIDMFDCVIPTRSGRLGRVFTARGTVNLRNARHKADSRPLDESCACQACQHYSRAYLHHLFRCGEMLGPILATLHNLTYYQTLMQGIRDAIAETRFTAFKQHCHTGWAKGDIEANS